jgi:hypothetical protein
MVLELHRYQRNGPDSEGFFSGIPDDRPAAVLVCTPAGRIVSCEDIYKRVCGPSRS